MQVPNKVVPRLLDGVRLTGSCRCSPLAMTETSTTHGRAFGKDHKPYHNAWLGDRWSGWLRDTPDGAFR